jgi:hypothetical protein
MNQTILKQTILNKSILKQTIMKPTIMKPTILKQTIMKPTILNKSIQKQFIIYGGVHIINNSFKIMPSSIMLEKSNDWVNAILHINKTPYYRLLPDINNYMELELINDKQILKVNNKIIYSSYEVFGYTIDVNLKKCF